MITQHVPGDPGYDTARCAWNLAADQRPDRVAVARHAGDVAAIVREAARCGLRVAAQGTGHNALAQPGLRGSILLRTQMMRGVSVDRATRTARAEAGALWGDVTDLAAQHGLAALAGSARDVGVAGYTLGGGISWLARRHGFACDHVTAIELVTADGRQRRVDAGCEPELFWALRGGGGGFGVVTALEFGLLEVPEVTAGALFWPMHQAREALHAWVRWTEELPDDVTSVGRLLRVPGLPAIPEFLRGQSFAVVEVCALDERDPGELLAPLRAAGPAMDTVGRIPAAALGELHMDPDGPVAGIGDGVMLDSLGPQLVDALVDAAGAASGSTLLSAELRHLGGALGHNRAGQGAAGPLHAQAGLYAVGPAWTAEEANLTRGYLQQALDAVAPFRHERGQLNFTLPGEDPLFSAQATRRLQAVKAQYDPDGLFVGPIAEVPARSGA